jgi:hypothetical protein
MRRKATHNSTYKKLAVQWLNEALSFVSSSVLADSFRLRNRQLLVAAKRCYKILSIARLIKSLTVVSSCRALSFRAFKFLVFI